MPGKGLVVLPIPVGVPDPTALTQVNVAEPLVMKSCPRKTFTTLVLVGAAVTCVEVPPLPYALYLRPTPEFVIHISLPFVDAALLTFPVPPSVNAVVRSSAPALSSLPIILGVPFTKKVADAVPATTS